jgi:hypothetical protein
MRFVLVLLMISVTLWGNENMHHHGHENGQGSGFGAGGVVFDTWGFMYRHHFANNFGVSTSLGGWFSNNRGYIGNEVGLLYSLAHHKFSWASMPSASIRIYLASYLAYIYRKHASEWETKSTPEHVWDIGLGVGPGAEFFFSKHFAVHLELPWMSFVKIANKDVSFLSSYPHFGGGVIYYF